MSRASGLWLGAALFALPIANASAELPAYDLKAFCHKVASSGNVSDPQAIVKGCYQVERESYDALKPIWDKLPAKVRAYCNKVARANGPGSYIVLEGCVAEEQSSAKANANSQLQR